jgi:hypothetical protein
MYQPYQQQQLVIAKPKKAKDKPIPTIFPASLYSAIRSSCIYLALDNNPENPLNNNSSPIINTYTINGVDTQLFYYSPDLLKMWLRFLVSKSPWSKTVKVQKVKKSKSGYTTYQSEGTDDVTCLYIPTDTELTNAASSDYMTIDELRYCANQIRSYLISVGPSSTRLLLPTDILVGSVPAANQVTTPNNITKQSRISEIGYSKCALDPTEASKWNSFYTMEIARFKYILAQVTHTRVTDASIRSLNETDRNVYNQHAVSNYIGMMSQYGPSLQQSDTVVTNKVSSGNAINPALIAFQNIAATTKNNKPAGGISSNKKYSVMIENYYRLTRFKLDAKSEKAAKTFPLRSCDIDWMEDLIHKYPLIMFVHNPSTNRPEVVQSSIQSIPLLQQSHYQQPVQQIQSAHQVGYQQQLGQLGHQQQLGQLGYQQSHVQYIQQPHVQQPHTQQMITNNQQHNQLHMQNQRPIYNASVNSINAYVPTQQSHQQPTQISIPNLSRTPSVSIPAVDSHDELVDEELVLDA